MRIGAHLSIAKGLDKAIDMALKIGANTFQFFTRNPRGGSARTIPAEEIALFQREKAKHDQKDIVGHLPYTVNLATPKEDLFEFACRVLKEDLRRFSEVGVEYLVTHPGAHLGTGESAGIKRLAAAIDQAFADYDGTTMLLLETMSGRGSEIGGHLAHLGAVLNMIKYPEHVGICLDSCHLFAAGYDLRTKEGVDALVHDVQQTVGFDKVRMIHINDSAYPCGSKQDRHANIGQGEMGLEAFANLIKAPKIAALPWLLETPQDDYRGYAQEIELLIGLKE
ncbi:MAG: deoxyribonuclease IV [Limnochordia bacterium]|nr:deoxyribonuclease IV [Limnochordia bacterium]MDD2628891.1 deoxyribonuclease IV [Limnochordia bacterium]